MKKIGIVGSRRCNSPDDYAVIKSAFFARYEYGDEIVSGGCCVGADSFAERIAKQYQIPIKIYYAAWDRLGKSAGFNRNGQIAQGSEILIAAVAEDRTGGTEDTIKKFKKIHPHKEVALV